MSYSVAEVAVCLKLEQTLDYRIPEEWRAQVKVGQRVRVSVRDQRDVVGFIVALKGQSTMGLLREISALESFELSERDLTLARWISEYYLAPWGIVLQTMAPSLSKARSPYTVQYVQANLSLRALVEQITKLAVRAPQQAAILKALLSLPSPTVTELLERVGCGPGPLKALTDAKIVQITKRPKSRQAYHEPPKALRLSGEQDRALAEIVRTLDENEARAVLLHGVNGSGKTEVYLRACQQALARGGQAIVLVPEISLTPQLVARFRNVFSEQIAVYHSGLTQSEKARQWHRIKESDAKIAIGVRAAIFAPLDRLRLIIVDEEHESTYKQDDPTPRYHIRDVALQKARLHSATVVLGSATPSIESYFCAQEGRYRHLKLQERVVGSAAPTIKILNLEGQKNLLSPQLREKITERLQAREQVILLLNRLDYSSVLCRACQQTIKCPHCRIALTLSLSGHILRCRYCGYAQRWPRCPQCRSQELIYVGGGTERLELELRRAFPKAAIRRMDSESVRRGEHGAILEMFRQGEIQILLGTQMIGLGLDFPQVTLVGIVNADTLLNFPDFRSGERTFQLISQAAGRASRGEKAGEVLIQTRHPEHPAIQLAARQDYQAFYDLEIAARRELRYPPFVQLISVRLEHPNEAKAQEQAHLLARQLQNSSESTEILGPTQALPYRRQGRYQWQLLLKSTNAATKDALRLAIKELKLSDLVSINVDPQL